MLFYFELNAESFVISFFLRRSFKWSDLKGYNLGEDKIKLVLKNEQKIDFRNYVQKKRKKEFISDLKNIFQQRVL